MEILYLHQTSLIEDEVVVNSTHSKAYSKKRAKHTKIHRTFDRKSMQKSHTVSIVNSLLQATRECNTE